MALRQEELTRLCDDVDLDRDRALVERCQAGDAAAFGNLYARYYERLLRFCLRRLNDCHEAEDATQETFARAWKALPSFAGDRRFYPWLTVIARNICTDMLRRRSRSTPTDDLELAVRQPVGAESEVTSEDLVLAAVDGELVHQALDRLSRRHRHVLAMREASGWSYQRIADHEGVEIGTVETLLWRARQALKREFAAVSESKGALAGFLAATGALIRRTMIRAAYRSASVQHQSGGPGALRNAVAGVAVAGAAVATALIAPPTLSGNPNPAARGPVPAGSRLAPGAPARAGGAAISGGAATPEGLPRSPGSAPGTGTVANTGAHSSAPGGTGSSADATLPVGPPGGGVHGVTGGSGNALGGAAAGLQHTVNGVTGGLTTALSGVASTVSGPSQSLGLGTVVPGTGSAPASTTTTTTAPGLPGGLDSPVSSVLGTG